MKSIKNFYIAVFLTAAISIIGLDVITYADDVSIKLGSDNGDDAFDVQNSGGDSLMKVLSDGGIQIGNKDVDCTAGIVGTIRFTGTDFEGCNGSEWVSLSVPGLGDVLYAIGDTGPAGGIVFYITDGGLHGLEAALADKSSGAKWGCFGTEIIEGDDRIAYRSGAQNTADIIANCNDTGSAAKIADAYRTGGYNDWFLPSRNELNELYLQKVAGVVGGFADGSYWSSSEYDGDEACSQRFSSGVLGYHDKYYFLRVRAVRAF